MSDAAKKTPLVQEFERAFGQLNKGLFGDRFRLPTHVVQPDKKVVFRFVGNTPNAYHITVGGYFGKLKTIKELVQEYLHEMVHISNWYDNILDCTTNQYHRREFLDAALKVGFYVSRHKVQGWGITRIDPPKIENTQAPEEEAARRLAELLENFKFQKDVFENSREEIRRLANTPRKVCFLKYVCQCPPPHNSIRSGRRPDGLHPLKIRCENCNSLFVLAKGR